MTNEKTRFCHQLRALRKARGLSLRELSEELGKHGYVASHTTLAAYEKQSRRTPNLPRDLLAALVRVFNTDLSNLLGDEYKDLMPKNKARGRIRFWQDLELLTEEEHELLLKLKNEFLKNKAEHLNKVVALAPPEIKDNKNKKA